MHTQFKAAQKYCDQVTVCRLQQCILGGLVKGQQPNINTINTINDQPAVAMTRDYGGGYLDSSVYGYKYRNHMSRGTGSLIKGIV